MTKFIITTLSIIILILSPIKSYSHPHVFITTSINLSFNNQAIDGINITWSFDRMFTQIMIDEYDVNHNNTFDPDEVKRLYNTAFTNLKKSNYFTEIYANKKKIKIDKVTNFNAKLIDGQMFYYFTIPLKLSSNIEYIDIYSFDESYYMDMIYSDNNAISTDSNNIELQYNIDDDMNKTYYFNQIFAQVAHIKIIKK